MPQESVLLALKELDFMSGLEPEQLQKLASMAFEASFPEGQMIFREGDVGELIYVVQEGQVAIEMHVPGQGRTAVLTVGPGQLLGWSSLFPPTRKTASARTMRPTRAIGLNAAQLRETIEQDHDLGCILLWRVAEIIASRLRATRLQLLDIFSPAAGR